MEFNHRTGKLKNFAFYLPRALKFFDLGDEYLTPVIFTIMLLAGFLGSFLIKPVNDTGSMVQVDAATMLLYIFVGIVTKLALSAYLTGCIRQFKGEKFTLGSSLMLAVRRSFKILAASFIYTMFTTVLIFALALIGFLILALPVLVIYTMYLFHTCYIVDKNYGIAASFKASRNITKGYKWRIFTISLAFSLVYMLASLFVVGMFITSGSLLIYTFVLYFLLTIFNLMNERLIALIYCDLEYGRSTPERVEHL